MRSSLKKLIPPSVRSALRNAVLGHRNYRRPSYAQEGEDLLLLRLFEDAPPGIFVDVGAHHPHRFSNTFLLYERGWRGINIDPRPGMAAAFARDRPLDVSLELGVSESPSRLELHLFEEPALNTFDASLAASRIRDGWPLAEKRWVDCLPLADILSRYLPKLQATQIDLLTVDVEGLDLAVLRSNDWTRYRPRAVIAEVLEADLQTLLTSDVARLLSQHGYSLQSKLINSALFLRQS
jgi:FkbM family methyltransferase